MTVAEGQIERRRDVFCCVYWERKLIWHHWKPLTMASLFPETNGASRCSQHPLK